MAASVCTIAVIHTRKIQHSFGLLSTSSRVIQIYSDEVRRYENKEDRTVPLIPLHNGIRKANQWKSRTPFSINSTWDCIGSLHMPHWNNDHRILLPRTPNWTLHSVAVKKKRNSTLDVTNPSQSLPQKASLIGDRHISAPTNRGKQPPFFLTEVCLVISPSTNLPDSSTKIHAPLQMCSDVVAFGVLLCCSTSRGSNMPTSKIVHLCYLQQHPFIQWA